MPAFNFDFLNDFFGGDSDFIPLIGLIGGTVGKIGEAAPDTPEGLQALATNETFATLLLRDPELTRIMHSGDPLEGPNKDRFNRMLTAAGSVANVQAYLAKQVAMIRSTAEDKGVTYLGGVFPTDIDSRADYALASFEASQNSSYTTRWKASTGFLTLNAAQTISLARAVAQYLTSVRTREAVLNDAIYAESTVAGLNAIDIEAGWP